MKNLFKRVYIKHDNNVLISQGQKRLIVTSREYDYPFTDDPNLLQQLRIIGYHKSLSDLDAHYGDRDSFWASIIADEDRIVLIAEAAVLAELLIQYWKSIFKSTTAESLWILYQYFVRNENLLSYRERERIMMDSDANVMERRVVGLDKKVFESIYKNTESCNILKGISKTDLPMEYLLMGYLGETNEPSTNTTTVRKLKDIVLENIVRSLCNAREDFFSESHNFYLALDHEKTIEDPLKDFSTHPDMLWVLDEKFVPKNEAEIMKKYTMHDFKRFFQLYSKIFRYQMDEEFALDFLIKSDFKGLLDYDIQDEKGNFLGTESFASKINGLLVSYIYQLKRRGEESVLKNYELI